MASITTPKNEKKPNRKKKVTLLTTAVVLVGGAAFAYWTGTGSGTGTGSTATAVTALTAVQTSTVSNLAPGATAQPLSGNFNNSNSGPVYVATVTASIASVVKAAGAVAGTCDATDYTLVNATMTVDAQVPAGTAQGAWTGATIQFNNKATNQDQCKGATVNLAYAIA
ncbi:MAG: hypothetical protein H0X12_04540 [Nocardioides sp.]|nr:hypothetical protein [Nocardioides sp.]